MGDPVLWVGGWASGLACWRAELEARYPGREHRFLDAHAALSDPSALPAAAAALPPGGTVAAWSLGSLLLHRALEEGRLPERSMISLSPIFDFTGPGSPWPTAVLARMIRRLGRDREGVLREFWALAKGGSPVGSAAEEAWARQAAGYPLTSLVAGLEALGGLKADASHPALAEGRVILVASPDDPLSPAPRGEDGARLILYPAGHLPFLDHPGLLGPLLDAPVRGGRP